MKLEFDLIRILAIITFLTGALDRNTPRTCTPENAGSGALKEEEMLLTPYVQEFDTDTKRIARLPPQNPYQRRA